jgi:hypothetical protein
MAKNDVIRRCSIGVEAVAGTYGKKFSDNFSKIRPPEKCADGCYFRNGICIHCNENEESDSQLPLFEDSGSNDGN